MARSHGQRRRQRRTPVNQATRVAQRPCSSDPPPTRVRTMPYPRIRVRTGHTLEFRMFGDNQDIKSVSCALSYNPQSVNANSKTLQYQELKNGIILATILFLALCIVCWLKTDPVGGGGAGPSASTPIASAPSDSRMSRSSGSAAPNAPVDVSTTLCVYLYYNGIGDMSSTSCAYDDVITMSCGLMT